MTSSNSLSGSRPIAGREVREVSSTRTWTQTIFQYVVAFGLAALSYFFISRFILQSVKVVGTSMTPTLQDSQHYLLNRWIYHVRSPHRAEIVVLRDPLDNGYSVKRVVAGAGDSIYIRGGHVFVNGHQLQEPYLSANTPTYTYTHYRDELIVCGRNQYFVLGDNRKNSVDSRSYGPIPLKNILGMLVH